ncbi:hypothetical protein PILCRDRAFT_662446 [Piloderma croceum F 1598]|uniref:G domain-containing protein n=1 Tax=Piloderma croceum (strain F 1598) TaxID=765440 RepID=A0A0C3APL7_PILCF|nr:hypothetical protein PILCRDRAFT_662446 [Piloderma croceum F 1598]
MGVTGAGKSTFIKTASGQNGESINHQLRSRPAPIRPVRATNSNGSQSVVLVDTPGFNDTTRSDLEILTTISDYLMKTYKKKAKLAAIIYLHKISDNRMSGAVMRNLRTFRNLCGSEAMPNVVIATTMWGEVEKDVGEQRERELMSDFWNQMVADGCTTERFDDTYESAWGIIRNIVQKNTATTLQIHTEMGAAGKALHNTAAGIQANDATRNVSTSLMMRFRNWLRPPKMHPYRF